ncbi:MAG: hypothetical protein IJ444_01955 [Kiritimatiellae bacterium]|nr:hypothetical protein [Kiritimatiellia bacterium]
MATKTIRTIFQFRRDTAVNWEANKTVVPYAGEPCYDLDNKTLRIGDGTTTYENLPVIGEVEIAGDGKSISYVNGVIEIVGFEGAAAGAQLTKGSDGSVSWVVPSTDTVDGLQTTVGNLGNRVTANENAIATLNGDGEGSVTKTVDDAINAFAEEISADGTVNTFKELVDYVADHAPEAADMAADIATLQGLVGDKSVATQITEATDALDFEDGAQVNVIESVQVNGTALTVTDKAVNIPVGGDSLGVVKQSTEITVAADGTLGVGEISFDKIAAGEDIVTFDGGDASDYIQ